MAPILGTTAAEPTLAPVSPGERIVHLDVLRGIALFGVLIANIWLWFSGTIFRFPELMPKLTVLSPDSVAFFFVAIFVSGKALTTFSFLFGLGFAVQMMRAEAKGVPVVPVFSRRMAVLFAMGVVHAILLWYGDILATYALLGFVLLLFRNRGQKTVLVWALLLIVVVPLALTSVELVYSTLTAGEGAPVASEESAAVPAEPSDDETRDQVLLEGFISGEPTRIVQGNLVMLGDMYAPLRALRKFWLLGLFLIGLYVGRRRIFEDLAAHRTLLRRLIIWGFPVGLAATLGETALRVAFGGQEDTLAWFSLALAAIDIVATAPFAFAYIAAACLLLERSFWRRVLTPFASVGRMALSNYIGQTVICLLLYIGMGLMESGAHAVGLVLSCAIFGAQMVGSAWWLRRYRYGPLEWLWRSATYGRVQPMRLDQPVQTVQQVAR